MKTKIFLLTLLLLPYLFWTITLPISLSTEIPIDNFPILDTISSLIFIFSLIYMSSIVFWGLPYTIFSLGVLIWSKNKSSEDIYRTLIYSPVSLAGIASMGTFITLIFFWVIHSNQNVFFNNLFGSILFAFASAIINLVFGYFFVGIIMGVLSIAKKVKLIELNMTIMNNIEGKTPELINK